MRSSIFEKESTLSPLPGGTYSFLKKSDRKMKGNENQSPSTFLKASWNFEKLLASYQENGNLPPILSPTLPSEFDDVGSDLTLESSLSKSNISDDDKGDNDDIPLSMLSPTLPPIFENNDNTGILPGCKEPIPTENTNVVISSPRSTKANKNTGRLSYVRWLNKLDDRTRPRFPLRIKFINKLKYKSTFGLSTNLDGLGISTATPEPDRIDSQVETPRTPKHDKNSRSSPEKSNIRVFPERRGNVGFSKVEKTETLEQKNATDTSKRNMSDSVAKDVQPSPKRPKPSKFVKAKSIDVKASDEPIFDTRSARSEEKASQLNSKRLELAKLIKQVRSGIEKSGKKLTSMIMEVDLLLLHVVLYDVDEKYRYSADIQSTDKNWKMLDGDVARAIEKIDDYNGTQRAVNQSQFLKVLRGILMQLRALVVKRISSILQAKVKLLSSQINGEVDEETSKRIIRMQKVIIDNFNTTSEFILRSRPDYLNSVLSNKFPSTWRARATDKTFTGSETDDIRPGSQSYYLPLGSYSSLTEICSLICNYLREFVALFNYNNIENAIEYTLKCSI